MAEKNHQVESKLKNKTSKELRSSSSEKKDIAKKILSLIDLTSLNDTDTNFDIVNFCKLAKTEFGNVPAICIFSRFIPLAKKHLKNKKIKIATVTNFPHGSNDIKIALYETKLAIKRGANEVDIVFPYHALIQGDFDIAAKMIKNAKKICKKKTLKVIIESGILKNKDLIKMASEISIKNGADFIKTSTGKVAINATLEAAEIMLNTIKESGKKCGFKAAGGIKTVDEAQKYILLADKIMGENWVSSKTFRFGASGLLTDVLNVLKDSSDNVPTTAY